MRCFEMLDFGVEGIVVSGKGVRDWVEVLSGKLVFVEKVFGVLGLVRLKILLVVF